MDEQAQRLMIEAIGESLDTYMSGIRCWAAFCSAAKIEVHFPATGRDVIRYAAIFRSAPTFSTYLKHLRWAHRFLHLANSWEGSVLAEVRRGCLKTSIAPRSRLALQAKDVQQLVKRAVDTNDFEQASLLAIGRLFLFRMPSECLPLQIDGEHSKIEFIGHEACITLMYRKSCRGPSTLRRECCCKSSGKRLCAFHWLQVCVETARHDGRNNLFRKTSAQFVRKLRADASSLVLERAQELGSHALRRGMARDIIDCGGSLATLLRAGAWSSSAFAAYLKEHQVEDCSVARLVVDHSDSE